MTLAVRTDRPSSTDCEAMVWHLLVVFHRILPHSVRSVRSNTRRGGTDVTGGPILRPISRVGAPAESRCRRSALATANGGWPPPMTLFLTSYSASPSSPASGASLSTEPTSWLTLMESDVGVGRPSATARR